MPSSGFFYDAAVVGAGPAGLFAASSLARHRPDIKMAVIDAGQDMDARLLVPSRAGAGWAPLTGFGGAGFFLGGRLWYDPKSTSARPANVDVDRGAVLLESVDQMLAGWGVGAPRQMEPPDELAAAASRAAEVGLTWRLAYPARHLGADDRRLALTGLRAGLDKFGTHMFMETRAGLVGQVAGGWRLDLEDGSNRHSLNARCLLLAPGRGGAEWLAGTSGSLGLDVELETSVGVRLEARAETLAPLTDLSPDPRLFWTPEPAGSGELRTYAFVRNGRVIVVEGAAGPRVTCRGAGNQPSSNTSVAILWRPGAGTSVSLPLPTAPAVQRLGALGLSCTRTGGANGSVQPTCSVPPGDVRCHWPDEYWTGLSSFLARMDTLAPGISAPETLVYSPAVERIWRLPLDENGQTRCPGLFVAGDGAGLSQGAMAAAASGLVAAGGMAAYLDSPA